MLYLVGLGLGSIDDITIRGQKAIENSDFVYLDTYTSIIPNIETSLKNQFNKEVISAHRDVVESSHDIIERAKTAIVSFLVVGDPLSATTHTAIESNVEFKVVHNSSIMTAAGCCGLMLYNFGITVSIPFWDEFGAPESFYQRIEDNFSRGLHTLCLLDIKVRERSLQNTLKNLDIFEPPRFMTFFEAAKQICQIIKSRPATLITTSCLAICLASVGSDHQAINVCTLDNLLTPCQTSLGKPLHSLIIPGHISEFEAEFLVSSFKTSRSCASLSTFIYGNNKPNLEQCMRAIQLHNELIPNKTI